MSILVANKSTAPLITCLFGESLKLERVWDHTQ